ncbi:MAG: PAS domain S-box protein [Rhodoferax sp.]|uniref:PAS domain S-box protein n=1 Tax=Rhodoferax sp. TaxID=50421 RepID=UPI0026207F98|nr:PAS domain S-box protein [Rhodoferax sp.]MDD5332508.1 PAS domain S-box protein [Rhodoferax sp.]
MSEPDLLTYSLLFLVPLLLLAGYCFHRRQVARKQVQTAIAESRNLLRTVIDSAPTRVYWKDRNSRYLGCNMGFVKDAGVGHPRELVGKDDFQMPWAAQAESFRADDRTVMTVGQAKLSYDEQQMTPDGRMIWCRKSKVPLRNKDNEVIGLLGIYQDITEHKGAEEELRKLSIAVEQSPASVVITDLQARIQYVNPRFTEVTGYSAAEALGQNPRILQSGQTAKEIYRELWDKLTSGQAWKGELVNQRKNHEIYWEDSQIAPVKNQAGTVTHYVAVKTDISERKRLENKLKEALSRLQKIASRLPGVVYQFRMRPDGSSCFPYASEAMTENFRVNPEEVREDASKVFATFHPDDHDSVVASIQSSARDLSPWHHEFRVKFADGTVHWLLGNAIPQKEEDGSVLWHGFVTDSTEHKRAEAVFHGLFDQSIFLAGILDQQGRLIKVNNTALLLTDSPREELIGKYFPDTPWWSNAPDRGKLIDALNLVCAGRPTSFEATHNTPNGGQINVMVSVMPISLEDGIQIAVVGVDITARKQLEDQVRQLAFQDALTKLPNRRLLTDRLSQTMAAAKRTGRHAALMFLDLDNFKPLNDAMGHDVGDLLLIEVAARLKNCVREIDTVGRLGGDEFVVLLSDLKVDRIESTWQAEMVAEKIRVALAEPYLLHTQQDGREGRSVEHHCTASIGVVVFIDHEASQHDILKWADAAMYQAKEEGRNTVRFHAVDR